MNSNQPLRDGETTRRALVVAALDLFGRNGYDATSTREIARAAGVNIAGIAYHFGGKDGLRLACANLVVERMRSVAAVASSDPDGAEMPTPEQALALLLAVVDRAVGFLARGPDSAAIARFMIREMQSPTDAFDIVYAGVFEPVHERLCQLWGAATGQVPDAAATRLAVFTTIGQIVYFRIARPAVLRRMAWDDIGQGEAEAIAVTIKRAVRAHVLAAAGERP